MVRAWWVNQGRSSKLGHGYGTVWAPIRGDNGRSVSSWDRMDEARPGDSIVHYSNGAIRGLSVVLAPTRTAPRPYDAGAWNNDGRILDVDYVALDIPIPLDEIPLQARLAEPKPHSAFTNAGAVNQGYFYPLTIDLLRMALAPAGIELEIAGIAEDEHLVFNGHSDRLGLARIRVEQPALRRRLLADRAEAPCGLCGVVASADYLVAAHIKRRADCSERERADVDVAMLACLFGCDAAFERGHVQVADDGIITIHARADRTRDRLDHLSGRPAPAFNSANRRYFRAHRAAHTLPATT